MYVNIHVTMATEFCQPCFSKIAFFSKKICSIFNIILLIELLHYTQFSIIYQSYYVYIFANEILAF